VLTLRVFDPTVLASGVALASFAFCALVVARRAHPVLYASVAFLTLAALPALIRGTLDALAWFGLSTLYAPAAVYWLGGLQGYLLLLAALPVAWSTAAPLRQNGPNSSLKRTNQSLRD
jgi:hypothetical protein